VNVEIIRRDDYIGPNPVGTQRQNDVVTTLISRFDVVTTSK